jgi:hypothetical protein
MEQKGDKYDMHTIPGQYTEEGIPKHMYVLE